MRRAHCGRKGTDGFCQLRPRRHYIWPLQVVQVQSLFLLSLGAWQFFTVSKIHSRYECNNVYILPTHVNSGWGAYNYSNLFHDLPSSLGHTSHLQHCSELQHDLYVVFPWLIFQCPEVLEISLGLNNQVISVYFISLKMKRFKEVCDHREGKTLFSRLIFASVDDKICSVASCVHQYPQFNPPFYRFVTHILHHVGMRLTFHHAFICQCSNAGVVDSMWNSWQSMNGWSFLKLLVYNTAWNSNMICT